jgi:Histone chaperone domain CHZ
MRCVLEHDSHHRILADDRHFYRLLKLVSQLPRTFSILFRSLLIILSADEPDDDNMEEIDTSNILSDGRRTRGRQIDFAKAAEELPEEEEDDDDDDDFEEPADEDKMEE